MSGRPRFLRSDGLCLLDRVVERLDHQSFVRVEQGSLEVAGSREMVVERALADAEPPTEPINAETVGALVGHCCEPGLEPVRTGGHTLTIPYGMVWSVVVTVIGGGLGGLAAAITAAEAGASVTLHEAHRTLGGRWRTTPVRRKDQRVYRAHEGPHVIYRDGPIWAWLKERRLLGVTCRVPVYAIARFRFWHRGRCAGAARGFLRAARIRSTGRTG